MANNKISLKGKRKISAAHRIQGAWGNEISGAPYYKKTCTNLLIDDKY
jgi:hypothetical protein